MVTVAYRYILLAHIHITTHIRYENKIEEKRPALVKNSEGKKKKTKNEKKRSNQNAHFVRPRFPPHQKNIKNSF